MSAARRFVTSSLAGCDATAVDSETATLLTSEVVRKVVVHAGPHPPGWETTVTLSRTPGVVRVEVTDRGAGLPLVGDGRLDGVSGRGLLLLDSLARAGGVTSTPAGIVVWFEVAT